MNQGIREISLNGNFLSAEGLEAWMGPRVWEKEMLLPCKTPPGFMGEINQMVGLGPRSLLF